jgi:predicted nucleic acid-binding protein
VDCLIAATALAHGLAVVLAASPISLDAGVETIDPWSAANE